MFTFAMAEPRTAPLAALPSTLFHVALVTGALWATRSAAEVFTGPRHEPIDITLHVPVRTPIGGHILPRVPGPITIADPSIPDIPDLDPVVLGTAPIDPRRLVPGIPGLPGTDSLGPMSGSATTIYQESEVDDVPVLRSAPAPRYPRVMAEAGIEGSVTLSFVIDVEGRVTAGSIKVIRATHEAFVAAAEEAVYAARFQPARRRGEAVPVLVRQTVSFRP